VLPALRQVRVPGLEQALEGAHVPRSLTKDGILLAREIAPLPCLFIHGGVVLKITSSTIVWPKIIHVKGAFVGANHLLMDWEGHPMMRGWLDSIEHI
jgi:hypothetical protein